MKKNDKKLIWELSAVIGCKLAIIAAICFVFFGPDTKTEQTPEAVSAGILSRNTSLINNEKGEGTCSQQN
uniref:cytochrome oxidase putative small subunit CydP n=1 Tax=Turicimonas muris TaxID=1796652 RepID=UPI00402A6031